MKTIVRKSHRQNKRREEEREVEPFLFVCDLLSLAGFNTRFTSF